MNKKSFFTGKDGKIFFVSNKSNIFFLLNETFNLTYGNSRKINDLLKLNLNLNDLSKRLNRHNDYTSYSLTRAKWKQIVEFEKIDGNY